METLSFRVVATDTNVSVMLVNDSGRCVAIADMDRTDQIDADNNDIWWLARLNVKPEYQRKGYGTILIDKLKENAKGLRIIVTPGGYNTPFEIQHDFYESCGFVDQEEGLMALDTQ